MNRNLFFIFIFMIMFTQTGCWDVQDVADTAFVTGIGIDVSDHPDMFKITFVMPKPSEIKSKSSKNYNIRETVEAENISGAIEKLETRLPRIVRLSHLRLVVIGDKLSATDIRKYSNLFEKDPEVALRTRVMFAQGKKAEEIFNVEPLMNRSTISELIGLAMSGKENALERTINLQELRKNMFIGKGTVLAPKISVKDDEKGSQFEHGGGAVLKDWRVIGWLNEKETSQSSWFLDSSRPRITGKMGRSHYTFSVDSKSVKIIPQLKGEALSFLVKVNASGNIIEERYGMDLSKPANLKMVQELLSRNVKGQIVAAVKKSQEFKADYLGFGRALEEKNFRYYQNLDWAQTFSNVPVSVQVKANIHRFGKTK